MRRFGSWLRDMTSAPYTRAKAQDIAEEVLTWSEDEQIEQANMVLDEANEDLMRVHAIMDEALTWYEDHLLTKSTFLSVLGYPYPSEQLEKTYRGLVSAVAEMDMITPL